MPRLLALALLSLLPASPVVAAECRADAARYTLATDPEGRQGEMRLERDPEPMAESDLRLVLVTRDPATQTRRFRFTASNGYSLNYLLPEEGSDLASEDALQVLFFRREAQGGALVTIDIPQADKPAPDAILVPRLGVALWYGAMGPEGRVAVATEFWLARCP